MNSWGLDRWKALVEYRSNATFKIAKTIFLGPFRPLVAPPWPPRPRLCTSSPEELDRVQETLLFHELSNAPGLTSIRDRQPRVPVGGIRGGQASGGAKAPQPGFSAVPSAVGGVPRCPQHATRVIPWWGDLDQLEAHTSKGGARVRCCQSCELGRASAGIGLSRHENPGHASRTT